jgi:trans-aconitate methyltransferase
MNRRRHWDQVYRAKGPQEVSWYQPRPDLSLALIATSGVSKDGGIVDVGGGASTLVDCLLSAGYRPVAVLDVSDVALAQARSRLGPRADEVEWFEADVTTFNPPHRFGLWHDRATFHFLTAADDRRRYVAALRRTLSPGGTVIMATSAMEGPKKCSGLDIARYSEESMGAELGAEFSLCEVRPQTHITPWHSEQQFVYFRFQWQS